MSYPGVRFINVLVFNALVANGQQYTKIIDLSSFAASVLMRYKRAGNPTVAFTFQTANTITFPVDADFNDAPVVPPLQIATAPALTTLWFINSVTARWCRFGLNKTTGTSTGNSTVLVTCKPLF